MLGNTPPERVRMIGLGVAALWLAISVIGVAVLGVRGSWYAITVATLLPMMLILLATYLAAAAIRLRSEAGDLRQELDKMRAEAARRRTGAPDAAVPAADDAGPEPVSEPQPPAAPGAAAVPQFASSRNRSGPAGEGAEPQAELDLDPMPVPPLQIPVPDLIRALNFPESAEDTEGFRALRLALQDYQTGQLIQAAQDVLTLLSEDGIFMEDLKPDRARPELWRRFARGERGGQIGTVGGIRDRSSLALTATRMREDTVFRDAAHHFLRRFDRLLAHSEAEIDDEMMVLLTDTRTARAFMLVGRVSGMFD
ncbi:MAG: hypothetical protein AAGH83_08375 [Pseudomonadota bacterium]